MAFTIRVGTILDGGGLPLDAYVIEKITHRTTETGKVYTVEAHTQRQRCFPGAAPATRWTDMELLRLLNKGTLTISSPR